MIVGGTAPDRDGWYVSPALVDGIGSDAPLASEEVFGPICAILPVPDDAAAVELSNSVRRGPATAIFTREQGKAARDVYTTTRTVAIAPGRAP